MAAAKQLSNRLKSANAAESRESQVVKIRLQFALAMLFAISGCTRTEEGVEADESTEASVSPRLWIDEGAAEIIKEQFDDGADHLFVIRWEAGALHGFAKLANADRDKSEAQKHVIRHDLESIVPGIIRTLSEFPRQNGSSQIEHERHGC